MSQLTIEVIQGVTYKALNSRLNAEWFKNYRFADSFNDHNCSWVAFVADFSLPNKAAVT